MIGFYTEEQFGEKFGENATQERILVIMQSNPKVSARAIAEEIGMTVRGVEKSIRNMKNAGRIKRIGTAKSGHWEIIEKQLPLNDCKSYMRKDVRNYGST